VTGVKKSGKTLLLKKISENIDEQAGNVIFLSGKELTEHWNIGKIIGDPSEGRKSQSLAAKVALHPNSVVFIDDVNKIHHSIMQILENTLKTGSMQNCFGGNIDFKNCFMFFSCLENEQSSIGFGGSRLSSSVDKSMHEIQGGSIVHAPIQPFNAIATRRVVYEKLKIMKQKLVLSNFK
jgi:hypothetical protein